jgi:hypothetical protein
MNLKNWRNASPEQCNLWDQVKGLIAWNTITPIHFQDSIGGSEFLTYNVGKLYIALECSFAYSAGGAQNATDLITFYNMANAIFYYVMNNAPVWDTTGAGMRHALNNSYEKNVFFSRITASGYTQMKFNGYRLVV